MEKQKRQRNSKIIEKTVIVPEIGKLPPQAPELEEAVLGALMLEKDAYSVVSDILKPESFYNPVHKVIFGAIQSLAIQQKPVDVLTVVEELKRRGELQAAGGAVYIAELSEKVASAAHIEYHSGSLPRNTWPATDCILIRSDATGFRRDHRWTT